MAIMDLFFPPRPVARPSPDKAAKPQVVTKPQAK